jgi:hypothetical protein
MGLCCLDFRSSLDADLFHLHIITFSYVWLLSTFADFSA